MRQKIPIDHPGGLIESPEAYLLNCTGRAYRKVDGFCLPVLPLLRQVDYESRNGESCPNCTPAALVNALAYYRHIWPRIPADPRECYRLLRRHVRLVQPPFPTIGGYPALLNAVLVRRLWRLLGIDAWPAIYPFPDARTLRKRSEQSGGPLVLSIWSKAYHGHTVLLLGWELWGDGRLFWIIHDGWRDAPRYLDAETGCIWQAVRMAK